MRVVILHRSTWLARVGLSVCAVVFASLVGCGGPTGPAPKAADTASKESVEGFLDLSEVDDVEAKPLTPEEQYVVNAARDRLVSECMAEAGFTWNVKTSKNIEPAPNPYPDLDELRRSGYGQDFEAAAKADRDAEQRFFDDPIHSVAEEDKKAFENALGGTDTLEYSTDDAQHSLRTGGCASEADVEIYGSVENSLWLSDTMEVGTSYELNSALMDVPEYEPALRAWQSCMYGYEIPWMTELEEDWPDWDSGYEVLRVKASLDGAPPSPSVTDRVIEADATCLESSGLHEVRQAHLEDVKAEVWKRAGAEEADKWRLQQFALQNAKKVS